MANSDSTRSASPSKLTLNRDTIANIRDALQIGLASYGEIERLFDAQEIRAANGHWFPHTLRG